MIYNHRLRRVEFIDGNGKVRYNLTIPQINRFREDRNLNISCFEAAERLYKEKNQWRCLA